MTQHSKDGGPAFPVVDTGGRMPTGLSMRDWFAGQALAGIMAGRTSPGEHTYTMSAEEVAATTIKYADAMLKARES